MERSSENCFSGGRFIYINRTGMKIGEEYLFHPY